ncbi:hypothetical protein MNEG_10256 [Monoraphidium neglectum]|uniref:Glycosyl hydrolase family 13 catalytic domain-containing protein n=1 Tax=Monoraphidium neglectum TaxID=145388 RepID=A0A0D2JDU2_9CHLO|nr:hypothetical protein MNEG_10256 [Monoraphidium neglectum]KIY97707.1 hypothetical protein MNEG_10256 [Monoraphidium neglectum]|eukprot:XP_013896727.1 hypothetical protein MNEG_10256 [Monoraphidium neglectum]
MSNGRRSSSSFEQTAACVRPIRRAAATVAVVVLAFLHGGRPVSAAGAEEWRGRVLYQLLVDRPVVRQCPRRRLGVAPYHGYWAQDLYAIEPHIGTPDDLRALVEKGHNAGLLVMLDVVANHVGACDTSTIHPFDSPYHYHDCSGCDGSCSIPRAAFDAADEGPLEHCRLAGLPDLNQSHPFVRHELLRWVGFMVTTFSLDGLRVDTAPEVARPFWREFSGAAGVFTLGEVAFTGLERLGFVASYAGPGALGSVLSYPMYGALRGVFGEGQDMDL